MIPTIEQIIFDLLVGKLSERDAIKMIGQHVESARQTSEDEELRDYTAIHAPPPPTWWMRDYASKAPDLDTVADCIAQWNYVYADSMLEARKK